MPSRRSKSLLCPCLNVSIDCSAAESEVPCPVGPNGSLVHPTPAVCELLNADEASHPIFATSAETPTADPQDKPRGWQPVYAPASLTTQGSHSSSTGSLVQQSAQSGSSQVLASGRAAFESLSVDAPSLAQPSVSGDLLAAATGLLIKQTGEVEQRWVCEKLPMLVQRVRVGRWIMSRCVLCSSHVYAQRFYGPQTDYILVNRDILMESKAAEHAKTFNNYSTVFGVVLPSLVALDQAEELDLNASYCGSTSSILSGSGIHPDSRRVAQIASEYLASEQAEMEDRIRAFVEAQHVAFEAVKTRARAEKQILLSALETATPLIDDGNDSAVPLSPLSTLTTTDPSPVVPCMALNDDTGLELELMRPKAHSNPSSMDNWKLHRTRHSGGSTRQAPHRPVLQHEDDELFVFDDLMAEPRVPFYESDTDDSGNGDDASGTLSPQPQEEEEEEVPIVPYRHRRNRHPAAPNGKAPPMAAQRGRPLIPESNMAYGTSLPVTIPGFGAAPRLRQQSWSSGSESNLDENDEAHLEDLTRDESLIAAEMAALVQQSQPWDERLFGCSRPNRKTSRCGF